MKIRIWLSIIICFCVQLLKGQQLKPGIVMSFDDYYIENWHSLLPVFEKHNAKATFFVSNVYKLNAKQIKLLKEIKSSGCEIASHGFKHLNAEKSFIELGVDEYVQQEVAPSIKWFDSVLNVQVKTFAYPFGARNSNTDSVLLNYFNLVRGTFYTIGRYEYVTEGVDARSLIYGLAIDDNRGYTMVDLGMQLFNCVNEQAIRVFYCHNPVDTVQDKYQIAINKLDSIMTFANNIGLEFYNFNDLYLEQK